MFWIPQEEQISELSLDLKIDFDLKDKIQQKQNKNMQLLRELLYKN